TGMTAKLTPADLERIRRQGIEPLSVEQGLELFDEAVARREPLLVPARITRAALDTGAPRPHAEDALGRRLGELAPAERRSAGLDLVRREVGAVFGLSARVVRDDQPLKSLGLASLMAVELRDRLGTRLRVPLPATLAFDHPTAADLARFVETVLP